MTLIYKLNQRVVHISEMLLAAPCSGGNFRNSRENPNLSASLADSWWKKFCDSRISSVLTIVYSDRNCFFVNCISNYLPHANINNMWLTYDGAETPEYLVDVSQAV